MSGPLGSSQWMYASGFEAERSLRLDDGRASHLEFTPTSAGNRRTFTISAWIKRAIIQSGTILSGGADNNNAFRFRWNGAALQAYDYSGSGNYFDWNLETKADLRDPAAWLHVMLVVDTTQATNTNRIKLYVNGTQQTDLETASYPSQNYDTEFNQADIVNRLGETHSVDSALNGYLSEVYLLDGIVGTPADFGKTGAYGKWEPIEYSGSFGTNGWYLPFKQDYTVEGFNVVTYRGQGVTGLTNYIGGVGFNPDFVWIKSRETGTDSHQLYDSVRGVNNSLKSDATDAEIVRTDGLTRFDTDGFTIGKHVYNNRNTSPYVAWSWDMGNNTPTGFSCVLSTGNATVKEVGGVGFQPDLVINETRSAHQNNFLYDAIRGPRRVLRTNHDVAEADSDALAAFRPDGFMRGSSNDGNENNVTYVDWCWDMGGTSAANTTGDINSTVMANTTYGQSIVSYTGNGSAGQTVGHGLSSAPEMIWVKNTSDADNWCVYCKTGGVIDETDFLRLDATMAVVDDADRWNDTAATSSVFTVDTDNQVNGSSDEMIAYCWHSVSGYSKIGSYSGDGTSDGSTVISCGFRPAWVMIKCINDTESWWVWDNVRNPFTNTQYRTAMNSESTETSNVSTSADNITFTSTGFALTGSGGGSNQNGNTYIFMAFAGGLDSIAPVNTDGSIDSRVKANTTYGQSIVSAVMPASGTGITLGHGLSSKPDMIILKSRSETAPWYVWHKGLASETQSYLKLNETDTYTGNTSVWNNTAPTSSVFSTVSNYSIGNSSSGIAYCFHDVTGYSKFGSYTGNGSTTGPSVTLGFRPSLLVIKSATVADSWFMMDTTRTPVTTLNTYLQAEQTADESTSSNANIDISDTGFQLKTAHESLNDNGDTYIYMAFADKREYAYSLDQSGNNNDWTSVALTESDIMVDNPSNNFATLNPLSYVGTLTEGNLEYLAPTSNSRSSASTMASSSGKWYAEVVIGKTGTNWVVGVASARFNPIVSDDKLHNYTGGNATYLHDGNKSLNGTQTSYGATYTTGDIIGIALDVDNGTVTFYKNNASQGSITLPASNDTAWQFALGSGTTGSTHHYNINFGQDSSFAGFKTSQGNQDSGGVGDFFYTPPSGFLAFCTKNLPEPTVTPSEHFNTVLYTGNGSAQAISGVGFQPDWVWLKRRSGAQNNNIFDSVRGANKLLAANTEDAEGSVSQFLNSFDSDGFTVGSASNVSANGETNVAFNWKAPTSFSNDASATSVGTIDSSGKINAAAGFSIISYTGNGTAGATVAHGLSSAPEMIIAKNREQSYGWIVGAFQINNTKALYLNDSSVTYDTNNYWNSTNPTSSVFSLGAAGGINIDTKDVIAYCFHSVDGYSKVGTYIGNDNNDGTFVYCGFKPAYVLIKNTNNSGEGFVYMNNKSDPDNVVGTYLTAYGTTQEQGTTSVRHSRSLDFLSNGFKIRGNSTEINDAEVTLFYAVAERPFKYSHAG